MAVVGAEEEATRTLDLRERDTNERLGKVTIPELLGRFKLLERPPSKLETELKARISSLAERK